MIIFCSKLDEKPGKGTVHFDDYVETVSWAQKYAMQKKVVIFRLKPVCSPIDREHPEFAETLDP